MPLRAFLTALALAVALAGCGFHLRGGVSLPEAYSPVYVVAPGLLGAEVEAALRAGGVAVTDDPGAAGARLEVAGERFARRTLSVDPDTGKAQEYELSYSTRFRLLDAGGDVLMGPRPIALQRDYLFDADAVLGSSRQQSVLREEMRRDAVQQLLRRVNAGLQP